MWILTVRLAARISNQHEDNGSWTELSTMVRCGIERTIQNLIMSLLKLETTADITGEQRTPLLVIRLRGFVGIAMAALAAPCIVGACSARFQE